MVYLLHHSLELVHEKENMFPLECVYESQIVQYEITSSISEGFVVFTSNIVSSFADMTSEY